MPSLTGVLVGTACHRPLIHAIPSMQSLSRRACLESRTRAGKPRPGDCSPPSPPTRGGGPPRRSRPELRRGLGVEVRRSTPPPSPASPRPHRSGRTDRIRGVLAADGQGGASRRVGRRPCPPERNTGRSPAAPPRRRGGRPARCAPRPRAISPRSSRTPAGSAAR